MTDDGRTTCRSCTLMRSNEEFRDPRLDPICRDCEVRPLSDEERAALEREEQEFRRRVKATGIRWTTEEEMPVVRARRAALAGVSPRRYSDAEESFFDLVVQVLWYGIYLHVAFFAGFVAIAKALTDPTAIMRSIIAILLLVLGALLWTLFTRSSFYAELELRSQLNDREVLHLILVVLSAFLVPVVVLVLLLNDVP